MGPLKVQCLTTCNTVEWDQGVCFDLSGISLKPEGNSALWHFNVSWFILQLHLTSFDNSLVGLEPTSPLLEVHRSPSTYWPIFPLESAMGPCRSRKRRGRGTAAWAPELQRNVSFAILDFFMISIDIHWYPLPSSTIIYHPHPLQDMDGDSGVDRCSKHCQRVALKLNLPASPHQLKRSDTSCLLWPETRPEDSTCDMSDMWVPPERGDLDRIWHIARHRSQMIPVQSNHQNLCKCKGATKEHINLAIYIYILMVSTTYRRHVHFLGDAAKCEPTKFYKCDAKFLTAGASWCIWAKSNQTVPPR